MIIEQQPSVALAKEGVIMIDKHIQASTLDKTIKILYNAQLVLNLTHII